LKLTSGGGSPTPQTQSTPTTNAPSTTRHHPKHHSRTVTINPVKFTVAVLNGTATHLLAQDVANRLGAAGFKQGAVSNAPDQTHATTVVQYLPGTINKDAAIAVAQKLGLTATVVAPIDSQTQAIACVQQTPCPPTSIVVTVGQDLSGNASATSTSAAQSSSAGATTPPSSAGALTGTTGALTGTTTAG
jgi:hypothetical protein